MEWRRARDAAAVEGLPPRVRKSKTTPEAAALAKANRRIERLETDLTTHKLALDIAGRAHALLEMLAESAPPLRDDPLERVGASGGEVDLLARCRPERNDQ